MNAHHDPIVRRELVATVIGRSIDNLRRDMLAGKFPPQDANIDRKTRGWRLSTIAAWNPRVARNIDALLKSPFIPPAA